MPTIMDTPPTASLPTELSSSKEDFLLHLESVTRHKYAHLKPTILHGSADTTLLEVTHQSVHYHPPAGYVHRLRMVITPTCTAYSYEVQVLFETINTGTISNEEDFTELCAFQMNPVYFKFCSGIDYNDYHQQYYAYIRFH